MCAAIQKYHAQEQQEQEPQLKGELHLPSSPIHTYHDHRMAMSFAPLGLLGPIEIEDPEVVNKSYPGFWEDLVRAGFEIQ